jgi:hypothetical protein
MSSLSPAPGARPMPAPAARKAAPKRVRWGWLEWFLVAQTFIPALLFIPGISPIRVVIRMASFLLALIAWAIVFASGRLKSGASSFSAGLWLKLTIAWLLLMIFNPGTNSIQAAVPHALFYISVFSPVFWVSSVLGTSRQVGRLMAISLVCSGLGALVGLGQVFRPATFNPPVIQGVQSAPGVIDDSLTAMIATYEDAHGNKIIRPCGLTDTAGGAAVAGSTVAIIGLAFALRPIGLLRRGLSLALAFAGIAVIYYSQVRMTLVFTLICLAALTAVFVLQKNFGAATLLSALGAALVVGAFAWVAARSGSVVVERFLTIKDFSSAYDKSYRGDYIRYALEVIAPENPLGIGLGTWGTMYGAFGDKGRPSNWVEVMIPALIVDGGIPLLLFYGMATVLAVASSLRIALASRDGELRYWAAVVFASNLGLLATCFSYVTFLSSMGIPFWFLAAVVHAADVRGRAEEAAARRKPRPAAPIAYPGAASPYLRPGPSAPPARPTAPA